MMRHRADEMIDEITRDALAGPVVAAAPDYFVMDEAGKNRDGVTG